MDPSNNQTNIIYSNQNHQPVNHGFRQFFRPQQPLQEQNIDAINNIQRSRQHIHQASNGDQSNLQREISFQNYYQQTQNILPPDSFQINSDMSEQTHQGQENMKPKISESHQPATPLSNSNSRFRDQEKQEFSQSRKLSCDETLDDTIIDCQANQSFLQNTTIQEPLFTNENGSKRALPTSESSQQRQMQQHIRQFYAAKSFIGAGSGQLINGQSKDIADEKNANDGQQNARAVQNSLNARTQTQSMGLAPNSGYQSRLRSPTAYNNPIARPKKNSLISRKLNESPLIEDYCTGYINFEGFRTPAHLRSPPKDIGNENQGIKEAQENSGLKNKAARSERLFQDDAQELQPDPDSLEHIDEAEKDVNRVIPDHCTSNLLKLQPVDQSEYKGMESIYQDDDIDRQTGENDNGMNMIKSKFEMHDPHDTELKEQDGEQGGRDQMLQQSTAGEWPDSLNNSSNGHATSDAVQIQPPITQVQNIAAQKRVQLQLPQSNEQAISDQAHYQNFHDISTTAAKQIVEDSSKFNVCQMFVKSNKNFAGIEITPSSVGVDQFKQGHPQNSPHNANNFTKSSLQPSLSSTNNLNKNNMETQLNSIRSSQMSQFSIPNDQNYAETKKPLSKKRPLEVLYQE